MKIKRLIFTPLVLLLSLPCICFAQQNQSSSIPILPSESLISHSIDRQLAEYWYNRRKYIQQGRLHLAEIEKNKILDTLKDRNIKSLPTLSSTFVAEGKDFLEKGNIEYAVKSFQSAITIDPYASIPYYYLAKSKLKQSKGNLLTYFSLSFKGLIAPFRNYKFSYLSKAQIIKIIFITLSLSIAVFIIMTFLKYQPLLRHDLSEILSLKLGSFWGNILPWFIILFPLIIMLGIIWVLIYWLIISWVYYHRKEKTLTLFFMLFLFLAHPIMILNNAFFSSIKSPTIMVTSTILADAYDTESIDNLNKLLVQNPNDLDTLFLLAYQLKKSGKLEYAFDQYYKILHIDRNFDKAYNNLSNIYFAIGEYSLAIENYKRAIALQPRQALYHYNLSLAYSEMLQFEKSRQALEKAEELDNALTYKLRRQTENKIADAEIDRDILKRKIWLELKRLLWEAADKPSLGRFSLLLAILINPISIITLIIFIIILILNHQWKGKRLAQFCDRCGKAFCYRCRIGFSPSKTCSQCEHIFIKQDGLLPTVKKAKISEIKNYQLRKNIQKWLFTLLLPGSGQQLEQRTISGFFINFLWFLCITILVGYNRLYLYQVYAKVGKLSFPQIIALIGLGIIYLIAFIKIRK